MKNKKIQDIYKRICSFVVQIIKLVKQIPKTLENIIIIKQLTKSATSISAND